MAGEGARLHLGRHRQHVSLHQASESGRFRLSQGVLPCFCDVLATIAQERACSRALEPAREGGDLGIFDEDRAGTRCEGQKDGLVEIQGGWASSLEASYFFCTVCRVYIITSG